MSALAYTSIYQMTYLLLETVEGKLTNATVNDCFQPFLLDLTEAIETNEWAHLEPARNSILEYCQPMIESQKDIDDVVQKLTATFDAWHVSYPEIIKLAKDVLKEAI